MKHPKLMIIDYYDSLINVIDIHTEELLRAYSETDILEEIEPNPRLKHNDNEIIRPYRVKSLNNPFNNTYKIDPSSLKTMGTFTPGLTRMWDYLNGTRDELIKFLRDAQKKTFEDYESIKNELKLAKNGTDEYDVMAKLFAKRFHFIIEIDNTNTKSKVKRFSVFKLIVIDLDFYLNRLGKSLIR